MKESGETGGYRKIYMELTRRLAQTDIAASAEMLGLGLNDAREAKVPFLGKTFLVSPTGVRRSDGQMFLDNIGSVLCHYIMNGSRCRPGGHGVGEPDV